MKIQFVRAHTYLPERINTFHVTMFHGETCRIGNRSGPDSLLYSHGYWEDLSDPLLFSCNAFKLPDVACPLGTYIVSQKVMELVKELPGLRIGLVKPKKIIFFPYEIGDFSFFERSDVKSDPYKFRSDKIFELWPDRPELKAQHFPRFEIVHANSYRMAKEKYLDAREISVPDPNGNFGSQTTFFSEKMLEENSIVGGARGAVFSPGAFSKIEPFLNPDYFEIMDLGI